MPAVLSERALCGGEIVSEYAWLYIEEENLTIFFFKDLLLLYLHYYVIFCHVLCKGMHLLHIQRCSRYCTLKILCGTVKFGISESQLGLVIIDCFTSVQNREYLIQME